MTLRHLPAGFLGGAATSAGPIEGSVEAAGRLPSIWDTFAATPGRSRFGLYWVDDETQDRVLKDSVPWYRDFIARHGVTDELSLPA